MVAAALKTEFAGRRGRLFRLALSTGAWTVLTFGIYRFWMKTRLRRFYWSSIRPGGVPLEYVGEPLEKLLGFLIAVVILAFYIGVINLLLMFASFSLYHGNVAAYVLSFAGVVPIMFYARYRARRYILARTRWRGLRFGMEQGAWGYALRALVHWAITLLTLGLLWPRMTFLLERYRTERTFFGTARFQQGGRWQMLYRPFLPLLAGLVLGGVTLGVAVASDPVAAAPIGVIAAVLVGYGLVHYSVHSFRLLTEAKTVGGLGFVARPRVLRVAWIQFSGHLLAAVLVSLVLSALAVGFAMLALGAFVLTTGTSMAELTESLTGWLVLVLTIPFYFMGFILWGVFRHLFVTLPLARHYAEMLAITGAAHLRDIRQRARDGFTEAEGFAEALDLGAAI